jgi:peroxiredoxin
VNPRTATAPHKALARIAAPAAVLALALPLVLAGCAGQGDRLADDYRDGTGGSYVSGDGATVTIGPDERGEAAEYSATTDAGEAVSSADVAGDVVVLNFWYAACGPCREEAADLEKLNQQFLDQGVVFLGVNVEDDAATAQSFAKAHGVTYPSVLDAADNSMLLAFAGDVPPNATPTTLVLDRKGRVAARFSGQISSPSLVADIIDRVLAEDS